MLDQLGSVFSHLIDVTKIPAKATVFLAMVTGLLLFLPTYILAGLRVEKFVETSGMWVGVVFIVASVLSLIHAGTFVFNRISFSQYKARRETEILLDLQRLDPGEKAVLREFLIQARSTVSMPIDEPTVAGLMRKGIVEQVGTLGVRSMSGFLLPVSMTSFALSMLHPEMLDVPKQPSELEKERLLKQRPTFVSDTMDHENRRAGLRYY